MRLQTRAQNQRRKLRGQTRAQRRERIEANMHIRNMCEFAGILQAHTYSHGGKRRSGGEVEVLSCALHIYVAATPEQYGQNMLQNMRPMRLRICFVTARMCGQNMLCNVLVHVLQTMLVTGRTCGRICFITAVQCASFMC